MSMQGLMCSMYSDQILAKTTYLMKESSFSVQLKPKIACRVCRSNVNCIIISALGKQYSRDLKYIWQLSKHPLRDYESLTHIR